MDTSTSSTSSGSTIQEASGTDQEMADSQKGKESFPFPFQPYPIQEDFMKNLYEALEGGKIGIFESPTGTVRITALLQMVDRGGGGGGGEWACAPPPKKK